MNVGHLHVPYDQLPPSDTVTCDVEYRLDGAPTYLSALPMQRIRPDLGAPPPPEVVHGMASSIFGLVPGTYQVRLTLKDTRQGLKEIRESPTDFAHIVILPEPRANPQNPSIVPVTDLSSLQSAVNNASPGDIIQCAPGTYSGTLTINADTVSDGTTLNPIMVRGLSRTGVRIDAQGGTGINVTGSSGAALRFWTFEDFSVINAHLGFQVLQNLNQIAEDLVFRRLELQINTGAWPTRNANAAGFEFRHRTKRRFHIYDCLIEGQETWATVAPQRNGETFGIHYSGQGHIFHHNTISGFGDCFGSTNVNLDIPNRYLTIRHNDILWCTDDGVEIDNQQRCVVCLENRITNALMGISCQPTFGGPIYIIKNFIYNTSWAPFKFKNNTGGMFTAHNTCVRGHGELNNAAWENFDGSWNQFRQLNNIFVSIRTSGSSTINCQPTLNGLQEINYNGYFPQGTFRYETTWGDFATMQSNGVEVNGRLLNGGTDQIFANIGDDLPQPWYTTQAEPRDPSLHTLSNARNGALLLPNIGHPDLGCVPFGGTVPDYGRRVGKLAIV